MSENSFNIKKLEASEVNPVAGNMTSTYGVTLYQYQGNAWINWSESFPGMVRLAVALYSGAPPSNAQAWMSAIEVTNQNTGAWNSGHTWGSGYSAALLGVNAANNAWIYIGCVTPVTVG
jgi:hypothetical protein